MSHAFSADIETIRRMPTVEAMLAEVCEITGMGFAAIARVTADRWIACQVLDRIGFGLDPGDELELKTTICDEIRASGNAVFIDHVGSDPNWRTHHTPALYGFESYVSVPIVRADGDFFGTLCAIDPAPRTRSLAQAMPRLERFAAEIAGEIDRVDRRV
ncbi:MAG: GAF domain-containing protein [Sphingomonas sp.]